MLTDFKATADRFLAALRVPLRRATVEDVRQALTTITAELAPSSARQVVLRVKSLLSYGHRLGYLQFNAGAVIRVHAEARAVSQRIVSEVEMGLLVRAAPSRRDRILIDNSSEQAAAVAFENDYCFRYRSGTESKEISIFCKQSTLHNYQGRLIAHGCLDLNRCCACRKHPAGTAG